MYVYLCVYMCRSVYMCVWMYMCRCMYTYVWMCIHECKLVYVLDSIYVYMCIYVCKHMWIVVWVCMYVGVCKQMNVHMHTCLSIHNYVYMSVYVLYSMFICVCENMDIYYMDTCMGIMDAHVHTHTPNRSKYISGIPYIFVLPFQVDFMLIKIWSYDSYFFWNSHIVSSQQYLQSWIWHQYPSISMDQQEFTDQI